MPPTSRKERKSCCLISLGVWPPACSQKSETQPLAMIAAQFDLRSPRTAASPMGRSGTILLLYVRMICRVEGPIISADYFESETESSTDSDQDELENQDRQPAPINRYAPSTASSIDNQCLLARPPPSDSTNLVRSVQTQRIPRAHVYRRLFAARLASF